MIDERLRANDRRARQGDPAAKARALAERVRIGEVQDSAVQLLASVGHAVSMGVHPEIKLRSNPLRALARTEDCVLVRELLLWIMHAILARWKVDLAGVSTEHSANHVDRNTVQQVDLFLRRPCEETARFLIDRTDIRYTSGDLPIEPEQVTNETGPLLPSAIYGTNLFRVCLDTWDTLREGALITKSTWPSVKLRLTSIFNAYVTFERYCSRSTVRKSRERCYTYVRDCAVAILLPDN